MQMQWRTKRLVLSSILIALGIGLQIAESMFFIPINIPGGKLGLANIVTVVILYLFDAKTAFVCAVLRSFLGSILYGGVTSAVYSVSGAVFAWLMMAISKRMSNGNLTQIGVSVIGAFSHNAAQVFVASVVLSNVWIFTYLPILGVASCITGVFTGYGARYAVKYLEKTGLCRK
ncbi:MAG: Gx transporter family protein [Ruminococcaceae bacterium]|nr:Gx transporter family protein [Oscillospiraceae bacterium]